MSVVYHAAINENFQTVLMKNPVRGLFMMKSSKETCWWYSYIAGLVVVVTAVSKGKFQKKINMLSPNLAKSIHS